MGGSPFNPNCVKCGVLKTEDNTKIIKKSTWKRFYSYCRVCENDKRLSRYYKAKKKPTKFQMRKYTHDTFQRLLMESPTGRELVRDFCVYLSENVLQKGAV